MTVPGIVAGLGCRRHCPGGAIAALVRQAEAECGRRAAALAAPWFKRDEPGLHEAASLLALPLIFVDEAALVAVQALCPTRSAAAERATGLASVAEAAALAATGGRLLLARIAHGGATCAVAER